MTLSKSVPNCRPQVVHHVNKPQCKVSVILLDWNVRESYHSLDYLNNQTEPRENYELIWLEFYDHKPEALVQKVTEADPAHPIIDKWLIAGYPNDTIFNKHRLYNLGILLAEGEICVICDSDAMFSPTFIASIRQAFAEMPDAVVHLDELRNHERNYYPFNYPAIDDVDWEPVWQSTTEHVEVSEDSVYVANYGACLAAKRTDLLAIGGADEHLDYLGYVCGPYELTFRLVNSGLKELWIRDEFLYHTWHPNQGGTNTDYQGPNDGLGMSLLSLELRHKGRVQPHLENTWIQQARTGREFSAQEITQLLQESPAPAWQVEQQPDSDQVYLVHMDYLGFRIYWYRDTWYGLPHTEGEFDPGYQQVYRTLIRAETRGELRSLIRHYNTLPKSMWRRLKRHPIRHWPGRIAHRIAIEFHRWITPVPKES